jgi:hypothetical protein
MRYAGEDLAAARQLHTIPTFARLPLRGFSTTKALMTG